MSLIQKLENSYVTVLRVVILIIATLLLIAAVGLGLIALYETFKSPETAASIKVDTTEVVNAVAPGDESKKASAVSSKTHKADFEKAYNVVVPFVKKYSQGKEKVDKAELYTVLDESISNFETPEVQKAYLDGWIETMGASLKNERVMARAARINAAKPAKKAAAAPVAVEEAAQSAQEAADAAAEAAEAGQDGVTEEETAAAAAAMEEEAMEEAVETPMTIVYEISSSYTELFAARQGEMESEEVAKTMTGKSPSVMFMTAAAVIFFSFLYIMFLTIAIRVERNLRDIAMRPATA